MYTVREQENEGMQILYMTYTWDGIGLVAVSEAEKNVGYSWPVPNWEPTRRFSKALSELPEHIQQALLHAKEIGQPYIDLGVKDTFNT
ncbi:hypothetical protein ACN4EG_21230 [Alkalinema pantanalense CENA528]|uniref:hypothetical protein n=1 Tax=Alkalinema pantanalense TaxID=1620705 RepID=UPI003D7013C4